jgi:dipeptidyl aminopeptidase/acylaminoacyl peptidase
MQPEDFYHFQFIADPQISPDGAMVAFVRSTISDNRRSRESSIWLVDANGAGEPRRYTRGTNDRSPRWSPDGSRIAFLSGRDGDTQLFVIPTQGGEAEAVTSLKQASISAMEWTPDGRSIILTLRMDPTVADPTSKKEEVSDPRPDIVVVTRAVYKADGTGFLDERRTTLWRLDLADRSLHRLAGGPDWNVRGATVSPTGDVVAFHANTSGQELDGAFEQHIYSVGLQGGEPRRLTNGDGRFEVLGFSPTGAEILYQYQAGRFEPSQLFRMPSRGGSGEMVYDGLEVTASGARWTSENRIHFTADRHGLRPLYMLSLPGNVADTLLAGGGSVAGPSFSREGRRVAFTWENERHLAEVFVADLERGEPVRLTSFNAPMLDTLALQPAESFWFTNETGEMVQGFVIRPVGFREGGRHPAVLNIKGGPGGMWGHQWFHEHQMLAARGFTVIFTNYRGSTGYGHAHQSAVRLDYGGADYRDNMLLVDEALRRFEWLDADRMFVTGGSHGGFLTNWITTQTDRFRAAVTQRSVSNWISEAGTQEYPPQAMREELGGTIWENFDHYWQRSPLAHADRVRTPTLVIHSTEDHITPIGQGQEWYYALLANDVPAEMVIFRGEGHGLSRTGTPVNLVERLKRIVGWFERWDAPATAER